MDNRIYQFLCNHLYLVGGALIIGAVTLATGSFTISVVGYSASYGISTLVEKIIR